MSLFFDHQFYSLSVFHHLNRSAFRISDYDVWQNLHQAKPSNQTAQPHQHQVQPGVSQPKHIFNISSFRDQEGHPENDYEIYDLDSPSRQLHPDWAEMKQSFMAIEHFSEYHRVSQQFFMIFLAFLYHFQDGILIEFGLGGASQRRSIWVWIVVFGTGIVEWGKVAFLACV